MGETRLERARVLCGGNPAHEGAVWGKPGSSARGCCVGETRRVRVLWGNPARGWCVETRREDAVGKHGARMLWGNLA